MEILPVVNSEGKVLKAMPREHLHDPQYGKLLHPVIHLHLMDNRSRLFLQLRPEHKKVQPGKWDTAVGGHVSYGESIESALKRETLEEIGIDLKDLNVSLLKKYLWETGIEKELVYLFVLKTEIKPNINPEELADGRFWTLSEINDAMDESIFTPNLKKEIGLLKEMKILK